MQNSSLIESTSSYYPPQGKALIGYPLAIGAGEGGEIPLCTKGASTMTTAEQPLKKRKLYDAAAAVDCVQKVVTAPSPLYSQDEIMRRRRNRDEIKCLYECYRRIRFYVSQKDCRLMPDFEQAYLSLIKASRGKRISFFSLFFCNSRSHFQYRFLVLRFSSIPN